jgi:glycosyltransferase involved in cell wall biosynthesis
MKNRKPMDAAAATLSVIVPVYNESATVLDVIEAVKAVPFRKEIIIVDDGSTDGTRDVLAGLADPSVRVQLHDRNRGKGAALRTGFGQATGDIVVVQDADLEYDPQDYGKLVRPIIEDKADVVYGSRFAGGEAHRILFFWHMVGNRLLTLLSNMLTNLNLTDMETGSKAFRRTVLDRLALEEDRFGFEPEFTAKIAKLRCRVYEVGVSYAGRSYAEGKKITWKDGVSAIRCIIKYNLFR